MIIYGSKASRLACETYNGKCPSCEEQNTVNFYIDQNYAHVFWIPSFPTGKKVFSECSNCKQVLKKKEFTNLMTESYENVNLRVKTPFWSFSGLVLFAIFLSAIFYMDKLKDEKNAKLILEPRAGDIIELKMDIKEYTLLKIENVIDDSVFVYFNNYETNMPSGLNDLYNEENFSDELYILFKKDLKEMFDEGKVIDIKRK
jgi:hypothetical protein